MNGAIQSTQITDLVTKLDALEGETYNSSLRIAVLQSLYVPILNRRSIQINKATEDSIFWIFEPSTTSFVDWLRSKIDTDVFFCVSGRVSLHHLVLSVEILIALCKGW
jgi:hypothetical protein